MRGLLVIPVITGSAAKLRFPVVGDWGGKDDEPYFTHAQESVADMMNEHCRLEECDFMVSIG